MIKLPKILPEPELPNSLSKNAKWLAGEGAGSWFVFETGSDVIEIKRYSPSGVLECSGDFSTNELFQLEEMFTITYPSHCLLVSVLQGGKSITLRRI